MRAWQNTALGGRFWVSKGVLLKAAKSRKIPGPVSLIGNAGFTRPGTGFSKPPFEITKPPIENPIPGTEIPIGGVVADTGGGASKNYFLKNSFLHDLCHIRAHAREGVPFLLRQEKKRTSFSFFFYLYSYLC